MYAFRVFGEPVTKGSGFIVVRGRAVPKHSSRMKKWEKAVRDASIENGLPEEPITEPVKVDLAFFLRKPQRPRNILPISRPDIDKLVRCTLDGLQTTKRDAGLISDDSIVVSLSAFKRYASEEEPQGCMVRLSIWSA